MRPVVAQQERRRRQLLLGSLLAKQEEERANEQGKGEPGKAAAEARGAGGQPKAAGTDARSDPPAPLPPPAAGPCRSQRQAEAVLRRLHPTATFLAAAQHSRRRGLTSLGSLASAPPAVSPPGQWRKPLPWAHLAQHEAEAAAIEIVARQELPVGIACASSRGRYKDGAGDTGSIPPSAPPSPAASTTAVHLTTLIAAKEYVAAELPVWHDRWAPVIDSVREVVMGPVQEQAARAAHEQRTAVAAEELTPRVDPAEVSKVLGSIPLPLVAAARNAKYRRTALHDLGRASRSLREELYSPLWSGLMNCDTARCSVGWLRSAAEALRPGLFGGVSAAPLAAAARQQQQQQQRGGATGVGGWADTIGAWRRLVELAAEGEEGLAMHAHEVLHTAVVGLLLLNRTLVGSLGQQPCAGSGGSSGGSGGAPPPPEPLACAAVSTMFLHARYQKNVCLVPSPSLLYDIFVYGTIVPSPNTPASATYPSSSASTDGDGCTPIPRYSGAHLHFVFKWSTCAPDLMYADAQLGWAVATRADRRVLEAAAAEVAVSRACWESVNALPQDQQEPEELQPGLEDFERENFELEGLELGPEFGGTTAGWLRKVRSALAAGGQLGHQNPQPQQQQQQQRQRPPVEPFEGLEEGSEEADEDGSSMLFCAGMFEWLWSGHGQEARRCRAVLRPLLNLRLMDTEYGSRTVENCTATAALQHVLRQVERAVDELDIQHGDWPDGMDPRFESLVQAANQRRRLTRERWVLEYEGQYRRGGHAAELREWLHSGGDYPPGDVSFTAVAEALRPGLLDAHPDSWGELMRRADASSGGRAHVEVLPVVHSGLLGLSLLSALPYDMLPYMRLAVCVALGDMYEQYMQESYGHMQESNGQYEAEDEVEHECIGQVIELFHVLAFLPCPWSLEPDSDWAYSHTQPPALPPAHLPRSDLNQQVYESNALAFMLGRCVQRADLMAALAACMRPQREGEAEDKGRWGASTGGTELMVRDAALLVLEAMLDMLGCTEDCDAEGEEEEEAEGEEGAGSVEEVAADASCRDINGTAAARTTSAAAPRYLGPGLSDWDVSLSLLELLKCRSIGRGVSSEGGHAPPPPAPSFLLAGRDHMTLALSFLHYLSWKDGADSCPLLFEPRLVEGPALTASALPPPPASQPGKVLLSGVQPGEVPDRSDPRYAAMYDKCDSYSTTVTGMSRCADQTKMVLGALVKQRMGTVWVKAEGTEGVERALLLAAKVAEGMRSEQRQVRVAVVACETHGIKQREDEARQAQRQRRVTSGGESTAGAGGASGGGGKGTGERESSAEAAVRGATVFDRAVTELVLASKHWLYWERREQKRHGGGGGVAAAPPPGRHFWKSSAEASASVDVLGRELAKALAGWSPVREGLYFELRLMEVGLDGAMVGMQGEARTALTVGCSVRGQNKEKKAKGQLKERLTEAQKRLQQALFRQE